MQTSSVMRWYTTACRWSCVESTHSRHDNEDRARADGVRIDCERATAAHDSRVREENLRQRALPRRSLGFDLRPADCNLIAINASGARARCASRYYTSGRTSARFTKCRKHISSDASARFAKCRQQSGANKCSLYKMPTAQILIHVVIQTQYGFPETQ